MTAPKRKRKKTSGKYVTPKHTGNMEYQDVQMALEVLEDFVHPGMYAGGDVSRRLLELLARLTDIKESSYWPNKVRLSSN